MTALLIAALTFYLLSIAAFATSSSSERFKESGFLAARVFVGIGLILQIGGFVLNWVHLGNFPVTNFKSVCAFIALAVVILHLSVTQRYMTRILPIFLMSCASLLMIISLHVPAPDALIPSTLTEALKNDLTTRILLPVHVMLLLFSYAAFLITVGCGVMYLMQERLLKAKRFGSLFQWLPALNTCDDISYMSITIGFVTLSLGMIAGMYWGNRHDGRFWHNDPKEVMTLITWVCYLAMLHYRVTAGWRGRRVAWLSIGGFVAMLLTFVAARIMGGYHVFG